MSTTERPKVTCPMCRNKSLKKHCTAEGANCSWMECENLDCTAVLDVRSGRGHKRHPDAKVDPKTKSVLRVRLDYDSRTKVWSHRAEDI